MLRFRRLGPLRCGWLGPHGPLRCGWLRGLGLLGGSLWLPLLGIGGLIRSQRRRPQSHRWLWLVCGLASFRLCQRVWFLPTSPEKSHLVLKINLSLSRIDWHFFFNTYSVSCVGKHSSPGRPERDDVKHLGISADHIGQEEVEHFGELVIDVTLTDFHSEMNTMKWRSILVFRNALITSGNLPWFWPGVNCFELLWEKLPSKILHEVGRVWPIRTSH